jgi:hypothetical protein
LTCHILVRPNFVHLSVEIDIVGNESRPFRNRALKVIQFLRPTRDLRTEHIFSSLWKSLCIRLFDTELSHSHVNRNVSFQSIMAVCTN